MKARRTHITSTGRLGRLFAAAILLVFALAAVSAARDATPTWRISIASAVAVHGPDVLLGDVAQVHGDISVLDRQKLASTKLFQAPDKGDRPFVLSKQQIVHVLRKALGENARFASVPSRMVVQRGGRIVGEAELVRLAVEYLTPRVAQMNGEAEFKDFRVPEYLLLDDEMDEIKVDVAGRLNPGIVSLRYDVVGADGRVVSHHTGTARMNLWVSVPCAARPVNKGEIVTPDKVVFKSKNAAYLSRSAWDGKGGPYRVRQSVGTGQVFFAHNLEGVPAVSKGETVNLVFKGKNITLSVPAEALSDGELGQMIKVRNLHSKRQVVARVEDTETVVVR